jgi:hypothetical protein
VPGIDERRLGSVLGRDWGFLTTVSENLARLPNVIPHLGRELKRRLAAMVSDVRERMERAPKSRKFNLRAKVGTRVPWYRTADSRL